MDLIVYVPTSSSSTNITAYCVTTL
uniref:Uncharacterized protein n=1 Tax=Arundo donax TaxID=35708 RepID=A0A0A9H690_ARUDO